MPLFSLQSNQYRFNFNAFHYRQAQYLTNQWLFKHLRNFYITCLSPFPLISFSGVEWILLYENMKPALKVWFTKFTAEQVTIVNECVFRWHSLPVYTVYSSSRGIGWWMVNHKPESTWRKYFLKYNLRYCTNKQLKSHPVNTLYKLNWYTLQTEAAHFSETSVTLPIDMA
jgi:hypothetical protein